MKNVLLSAALALATPLAHAQPVDGLPWQPIQPLATRVVATLSQPIWCGSPPADQTRLHVLSRGGSLSLVRVATDAKGQQTYTLRSGLTLTTSANNRSLAFAPDFASSGHVYIARETGWQGGSGTEVTRYTRSAADPDLFDATSATPVIRILGATGDHSTGSIHFGPDGFLYIGVGDSFNTFNPQSTAQLPGKLLRIDPTRDDFPTDTGRNYAIPAGNPYPISTQQNAPRPEILHVGLRNPWRWSFDPANGDLWIADVGAGAIEEVSVLRSGTPPLRNLGWPAFEGLRRMGGNNPLAAGTWLTKPLISYTHAQSPQGDELRGVNGNSITGGVVYRGNSIPTLRGRYLFADYTRSWVLAASAALPGDGRPIDLGPQLARLTTGNTVPLQSVVHFGTDAAGEVFTCEINTGRIRKIVPAP